MDRRVLFINEHPLRVAVCHTAWVNVDEGTEEEWSTQRDRGPATPHHDALTDATVGDAPCIIVINARLQ